MLRACLTVVAVAVLSACLVHLRDVQGQRPASADATQIAWVRTVDGWETKFCAAIGSSTPGPAEAAPWVGSYLTARGFFVRPAGASDGQSGCT